MASEQQRELSQGEMLGTFRIERMLGAGGFGITYLAFDSMIEDQVAIKEYFPPNAWRDQGSRLIRHHHGEAERAYKAGLDRFYREGQTLAKFKHPNIVRVRQMFPGNDTVYLVMDYEEGMELGEYLKRIARPLNYREAEELFNPILDGLREVHGKGLLHLDIKPENIYLRSDGNPMLIDFGGARHQVGKESKMVSSLVASEFYAPNEQYTGKHLQPTVDIYAVGATLYHCVTGKEPIDAKVRAASLIDGTPDPLTPVSQLLMHQDYPLHFLHAIDAAMSIRISDRPQSVRELQLRLFTEPVSVEPPTDPVQKPKWLTFGVGAGVLSAAIVGWLAWSPTHHQAPPIKPETPVPETPVIVLPDPAPKPPVETPNQPPPKPAKPSAPSFCKKNPEQCGVAPGY